MPVNQKGEMNENPVYGAESVAIIGLPSGSLWVSRT
jgi:hypothetical protein